MFSAGFKDRSRDNYEINSDSRLEISDILVQTDKEQEFNGETLQRLIDVA